MIGGQEGEGHGCPFLIGCPSALVGGLQDPERSRLLEAAMAVAGPRRLRELFRQQLKGRLRGVATHRVANHGLQRLLDHAPADVVGGAWRGGAGEGRGDGGVAERCGVRVELDRVERFLGRSLIGWGGCVGGTFGHSSLRAGLIGRA